MTDFFVRSSFLRNLEHALGVNPWESNLTLNQSLIGSNIQSMNLSACNVTVSQLTSGQVQVGSGGFSKFGCNVCKPLQHISMQHRYGRTRHGACQCILYSLDRAERCFMHSFERPDLLRRIPVDYF
jgi:hypothetical protein